MRKLPLAALVALLATVPAAPAQEMQPTWFTIIADHVDISNMPAYEEASREFTRLFAERDFDGMSWVTITTVVFSRRLRFSRISMTSSPM